MPRKAICRGVGTSKNRLLGFAVAAAFACSACGPSIAASFADADERMYHEDYVGAHQVYRQILRRLETQKQLDPASQTVRLGALQHLGQLNALYLRDYAQAIADFTSLIRHYPHAQASAAALVAVGDLYQYRLADLNQAIAWYENAVEEFPHSPQTPTAQLAVVHAYLKLKNYQQARSEAAKVIDRWPHSSEAAQAGFAMADAYYQEHQFTAAIAAYNNLLTGHPGAPVAPLARFELGNCYQEMGEPQQALDAYYSALPDHPNPTLVQRKITRVRSRVYNLAPNDSILNAQAPSPRMLALRHRRRTEQARRHE